MLEGDRSLKFVYLQNIKLSSKSSVLFTQPLARPFELCCPFFNALELSLTPLPRTFSTGAISQQAIANPIIGDACCIKSKASNSFCNGCAVHHILPVIVATIGQRVICFSWGIQF